MDHLKRARKICLALPETSEKIAWGSSTFRVRGRMFASYAENHHGDGRIALWCKAAPGSQQLLVEADPERFFVPPYVGKSGWVGIHLDRSPDALVKDVVRRAHLAAAPPAKARAKAKANPKEREPAKARAKATPDGAFAEFAATLTPAEREVVAALREVILHHAAKSTESIAWDALSYHRPEVGGPIKGGVCQIVVRRGVVRLDFVHGVRLRDPEHILQGDGVAKRFVIIGTARDAHRPAIAALIREAAGYLPPPSVPRPREDGPPRRAR